VVPVHCLMPGPSFCDTTTKRSGESRGKKASDVHKPQPFYGLHLKKKKNNNNNNNNNKKRMTLVVTHRFALFTHCKLKHGWL
jgi:hypothetical protein